MSSKRVVAMALPRNMYNVMFNANDLARLHDAAKVVGPAETGAAQHIQPLLEDAVVAITGWQTTRFDAPLLDHARHLKLIAHSAGTVKNLVDFAAYDRGIRITNAAAANAAPVAETTVAMMVAMLKGIPWLLATPADSGAVRTMNLREMRDLCIGLIGASRVGREVIRLLKSYPRLRVLVYDPFLTSSEAQQLGVETASLDDVCRCDVVSCHAPSLPATHHMLDGRTLALLPDHAVLINTSRGALINEAALVAEVRRRPLYVYLDVTDPEPPSPDSPLLREPNILITPHIAGCMNQGRHDMGRMAIDETLRYLRGEPLEQEVTAEMLPTQA